MPTFTPPKLTPLDAIARVAGFAGLAFGILLLCGVVSDIFGFVPVSLPILSVVAVGITAAMKFTRWYLLRRG